MPEYDFTNLSPYDFEILCRDLVQAELGVRLQSFTTGRDGGIDLRYAPAEDDSLIVQCKHYARSGYSRLLSSLKNDEKPKVETLAPKRYVLATSVGLTPGNVDEIYDVFVPWCKAREDVLGRDDLNNLLSLHEDVEKRHFKLWLTSVPVLEMILHNAVHVQSELDAEDIRRKLQVFVEVGTIRTAAEILANTHTCIISGIPGIGKTTLAQILLARYLAREWEIVTIRQNVDEGLDKFSRDPKDKQVFWYDDFLGQVSFGEKLAKNEDKAILQLIRSVGRHPNRRFILTTREYILQQAIRTHEPLSSEDIDLHKHALTLEDYSLVDKAKILYNHLYFCGVPEAHIDALLADRTYMKVVRHRNYSPRIIEWVTSSRTISHCEPEAYPRVLLETLDHPAALWAHAFVNQITLSSQHLLFVLVTAGSEVLLDQLRAAYQDFHAYCAEKYHRQTGPDDFHNALKELEGTFISINKHRSATTISLHNPSVTDYLVDHLRSVEQVVADLLVSARYFDQVSRTVALLRRGLEGDGSKTVLAPYGAEIEHTVKRTLGSESTQLCYFITYAGDRIPRAQAGQLYHQLAQCVTIGEIVVHDALRRFTLDQIKNAFADDCASIGNRSHVVHLLEAVEHASWIGPEFFRDRANDALSYLLGEPEAWEELCPTAKWVSGHPEAISGPARSAYITKLMGFIEEESDDLAGSADDQDIIWELQDDLETLESVLSLDFADHIAHLESYKADLPPSEDDSDSDWDGLERQAVRTTKEASENTIHSMFDALKSR